MMVGCSSPWVARQVQRPRNHQGRSTPRDAGQDTEEQARQDYFSALVPVFPSSTRDLVPWRIQSPPSGGTRDGGEPGAGRCGRVPLPTSPVNVWSGRLLLTARASVSNLLSLRSQRQQGVYDRRRHRTQTLEVNTVAPYEIPVPGPLQASSLSQFSSSGLGATYPGSTRCCL